MFRITIAALLLLWLSASQSTAAVISVDWKTGGDSLLTRDLSSGLEWLDLTETMSGGSNRTFDDVAGQFGAGGEFSGFRHATIAEVTAFWTSAGIPDINAGGTTANHDSVTNLISLLGDTSPGGTGFSLGITGQSDSAGTHVFAELFEVTPTIGRAVTDAGDVADDATTLNGGHYLVRAVAVPEPSSIAILFMTMIGVLVLQTRRTVMGRRSA